MKVTSVHLAISNLQLKTVEQRNKKEHVATTSLRMLEIIQLEQATRSQRYFSISIGSK